MIESPASPHARVKHPPQRLSLARTRAINTAMRCLLDGDDIGARTGPRWCARCRASRPAAGFISYDTADLCNRCATAYELYRAAGMVRTVTGFLATRPARPRRSASPVR